MDKLEYIPGDLAIVDDCIVKIITINFNYGLNKVDSYNAIFASGDAHRYGVKKLKPIPLTPGILEKNGWKKEEKDGSIFSLSEVFMGGDENDEDNYTCFQLYYQNKKDGWVIDMRGELLRFGVHYVHELQHLFFGLDINHEMEV